MDNASFQGMLAGIVGLNTMATFTLAFVVGVYKGQLDQWRTSISDTVKQHGEQITAIHQQDIRNAKVDSQMERQSELIKILGKRTHDLRNLLMVANLVPKGAPLSGFNEPASQGD